MRASIAWTSADDDPASACRACVMRRPSWFTCSSEVSPASFANISADEQLGQICADSVGDLLREVLAVHVGDATNGAEQDEGARAEDVALVELERDRLERQLRAGLLRDRAAQHLSRARAEGEEMRLVVARPLGEDEDVAAGHEVFGDASEHGFVVALALAGHVTSTNDRDRLGSLEEPLQAGDLPERALRHRRDPAGRLRQDEDGIDEPVDVVGCEESAAGARMGHLAGDLDLAEVDPREATKEDEKG